MRVRDALARDVGREVPAVVHLAGPADRLEAEVGEYVLTRGVGEQLAGLLGAMASAIEAGGEGLPAAWLSGPFGSGKSSLARLLGLSLDGARLGSGRPLREALVEKAAPALRPALARSFEAIERAGRPVVALFDAASFGREGEGLHEMALRAARARLGERRASGPKRRSPAEAASALSALVDQRAQGRTLVVVADEAGQHLGDDPSRALALQGLVASLGALGGKVWIVACGHQPLDRSGGGPLSSLAERFPPRYRLALSPAEAGEVLASRLLAKTAEGEEALARMAAEHRSEIALRSPPAGAPPGGETPAPRALVDLYPFSPALVPLLARLCAALGEGATAAAPRALLQLASFVLKGPLADRPLGAMASLDQALEAFGPALPSATTWALDRALADPRTGPSPLARRCLSALALLGLVPDERASADDVSRWIWPGPGMPDERAQVAAELERLRALGHLALSERRGYRLEDDRGRAWAARREALEAPEAAVGERVRALLAESLKQAPRPRLCGRALSWSASITDPAGRSERLVRSSLPAPLSLELRLLDAGAAVDRGAFAAESERAPDRLLWAASLPGEALESARALVRSQLALELAERDGADEERGRELVSDERLRGEAIASGLRALLEQALLSGEAFFRGRALSPSGAGPSLGAALAALGEQIAPAVYPRFQPAPARPGDAELLLAPRIVAPPAWMLPSGIGLLSDDGGAFVASCEGAEPRALLASLPAEGEPVERLIERLSGPPFGHGLDLVRVCLAALLRAGAVTLSVDGRELRSALESGAREALLDDRALRRARVIPAGTTSASPTPRDRVAVASLLESALGRPVDRDDEALADGVFALVRETSERLASPALSPEPAWLPPLRRALEACREARSARATVLAARKHERALREGLAALSSLAATPLDAAPAAPAAADEPAAPAAPAAPDAIELSVSGRVLRSRDELRALVREIDERAGEAIDRGEAVRLR